MDKKKILKLVSIFLLILLIIGGAFYIYFKYFNSSSNNSINYSFNTKASFKVKEHGKEDGFDLNIKNASIITKDSGLQQRIKFEKIDLNIIGEDKVTINNIDIVSDNQYVYLKGDLGKLTKKVPDVFFDNFPKKLIEVLEKGKYAKIDNSKSILDVLGKFKNNEIIKELVTGMVTSNPEAYFKKHNTIEKLIEFLKTDKALNFVFKDGEYDKETQKTSLVFNERLCELSPILNKATKEIYGFPIMEEDNKQCIEQLKEANKFLSMVNIYKKGDSKVGDYNFIIEQGKLTNINIEYKNHKINNWQISLNDPEGKFKFKANGNDKKLLSSLLKIDFDENGLKIKGEIKDGEGKINISSPEKGFFIMNGFIEFKGYFINKYDLKGESEMMKTSLIAKGDRKNGNIKFSQNGEKTEFNYKIGDNKITINGIVKNNKGEEEGKLDLNIEYGVFKILKYDLKTSIKGEFELKSKGDFDKKYLLVDFKSFRYNGELDVKQYFEGDYNNKKINLEFVEYKNGEKNDYINLSLKDSKIIGSIYDNKKKAIDITGVFENIGNFDIKINSMVDNILVNISGNQDNNNYEYKFNIDTEEVKNYVVGNAKIKFEDNKIISNGILKNEEEDFEAMYNFEHEYQIGKAKYEIPKDFEEVKLKTARNIILPNLEELGKYNNTQLATVAVTGGAIAGTIGYISLQGYSQESENVKVEQDLRSLAMAIEIGLTNGNIKKLSNLVLKGNKINFELLRQNPNDFKHPDGADYLIFIKEEDGYSLFQLFGYTIENGQKRAVIKGNYFQKDLSWPESLVKINGKFIKNGDIVGGEVMEYIFNNNLSNMNIRTRDFSGGINMSNDYSNKNNIFISQESRLRDSNRMQDLNILRSAIEQVYQDNMEYPKKENFKDSVKFYLPNLPKDKMRGKIINGCEFGYKYEVGDDQNGIEYGAYRISACRENDEKFTIGFLKDENVKESFYIDDLDNNSEKELTSDELHKKRIAEIRKKILEKKLTK